MYTTNVFKIPQGTPGDQFEHEGNVTGQVHEGIHEFTISQL